MTAKRTHGETIKPTGTSWQARADHVQHEQRRVRSGVVACTSGRRGQRGCGCPGCRVTRWTAERPDGSIAVALFPPTGWEG